MRVAHHAHGHGTPSRLSPTRNCSNLLVTCCCEDVTFEGILVAVCLDKQSVPAYKHFICTLFLFTLHLLLFYTFAFAQLPITMLLLTSMLRSLAVIYLFSSWTQAFSIDAYTCRNRYYDTTAHLISQTMLRIADALDVASNPNQEPKEKLDDTNQILYKTPTADLFRILSGNAQHMLQKYNWIHHNQQMDSFIIYCKADVFKPADNAGAGTKWVFTRGSGHGERVQYNGPSYGPQGSRATHDIACAEGDMVTSVFSDKFLGIILCPRMILEITRGYQDTQPINNGQTLHGYLNADHLVLNVFRLMYHYTFPQHTTTGADALTGWTDCVALDLNRALVNFYSFAYHTLARLFTTKVPGSAFVEGVWYDPRALGEAKQFLAECPPGGNL
ncbi:hypothetical protein BDV95DRAFT_556354 [Massariosphaeria phaeospora]|uniref:Uncharacterized protein n=1 Tax=Massariosphaeria phaeospora TaxID=100035 RepID=A0A7C8IEX6_9PLEO|nr:hypothetical protein BDV95DRAFT_556354 [Massariosphaeria phaeospora]